MNRVKERIGYAVSCVLGCLIWVAFFAFGTGAFFLPPQCGFFEFWSLSEETPACLVQEDR